MRVNLCYGVGTMRRLKNFDVRLFALGYAWTLLQLALGLQDKAGFGFAGRTTEVAAVAKHLAAAGEFRDPFFEVATGPTAHVAPVYTALFAAAIKAFGRPGAIVMAMVVFNACLCGLAAGLMPALAR